MNDKNQQFVRVSEVLPPVVDVEYHDPEVRDAVCSTGRFVRVCESLPPVEVEPRVLDGADEPGWTRGRAVRV